ncbi:YcgN family cysteine cluster protein [Maricaulis parjimensis]|uniref:YcgN family cysteine cluster protein n=1 Tax=Maricaulis parjimensis TaxID=144023 RepID=UPI00193A3E21|nr:YcgN family cysteine cluster protein [Maricaulis parjimensis]
MSAAFWKVKSLSEMTRREWESLCDHCGKCCLIKLEDEDTGTLLNTDIACKLYDCDRGGCRDYIQRKKHVPDCVVLTPETVDKLPWIPRTCAYRLIAEGRDLYDWHPLITGDPDSTRKAGMSVAGMVRPETEFQDVDWEDHIVEWAGEEDED